MSLKKLFKAWTEFQIFAGTVILGGALWYWDYAFALVAFAAIVDGCFDLVENQEVWYGGSSY